MIISTDEDASVGSYGSGAGYVFRENRDGLRSRENLLAFNSIDLERFLLASFHVFVFHIV